MKLLLHIGTEKTGSSYLQTLFALNRDQLRTSGIFYPTAGNRESDMLEGRISPGNGKALFEALRASNKNQVNILIKTYSSQAETKQCKTVLISNENLIEVLKDQLRFDLLRTCCEANSIDLTDLLLVLRDPVDQALSLFKHRAKNGQIGQLETWVESGYFLADHLSTFLTQLDLGNTELTVRSYTKDAKVLQTKVFNDWLRLDGVERQYNKSVNPSLTLSELKLLNYIASTKPKLVRPFYQSMLEIPLADKDKNTALTNQYKDVLADKLSDYNAIWKVCNSKLNQDAPFELPNKNTQSSVSEQGLSFSESQSMALVEFFMHNKHRSWQLKHLSRRVKGRLKYLINKFKN